MRLLIRPFIQFIGPKKQSRHSDKILFKNTNGKKCTFTKPNKKGNENDTGTFIYSHLQKYHALSDDLILNVAFEHNFSVVRIVNNVSVHNYFYLIVSKHVHTHKCNKYAMALKTLKLNHGTHSTATTKALNRQRDRENKEHTHSWYELNEWMNAKRTHSLFPNQIEIKMKTIKSQPLKSHYIFINTQRKNTQPKCFTDNRITNSQQQQAVRKGMERESEFNEEWRATDRTQRPGEWMNNMFKWKTNWINQTKKKERKKEQNKKKMSVKIVCFCVLKTILFNVFTLSRSLSVSLDVNGCSAVHQSQHEDGMKKEHFRIPFTRFLLYACMSLASARKNGISIFKTFWFI